MATFEGTPEQQAIWDYMDGDRELMVDAKAGTGKTTTMLGHLNRIARIARLTRQRVGFCAFTNSVAAELKRKVPAGIQAGTLHSFMRQVLLEAQPGAQLSRDKVYDSLNTLFPHARWSRGERYRLTKLVGLAKNEGITLDTIHTPTALRDFLYTLNERHTVWSLLQGPGNLIERTGKMLEYCADLSKLIETGFDFDDMLWLPYVHNLQPLVPYDHLIIDECQDTNLIQQANAFSVAKRVTAVGDTNQAIFGFRGADTRAVANLLQRMSARGQPDTLPLTICWRCPTVAIDLAQRLVPAIRPNPIALPGRLESLDSTQLLQQALPGDMLLCRTNAPLIRTLYNFWKCGTRAFMRGRQQIAARLLAMVHNVLNDTGCTSLTAFDHHLLLQEEEEIRRAVAAKGPDAAQYAVSDIRDRYSCLRVIAENARAVDDLKAQIDRIFADEDPASQVCLSSIHRAKGLEARRVFILDPHLLPHPSAKHDWEHEQELNLAYVAVTRTMHDLYFVGDLPAIFTSSPEPKPCADTPASTCATKPSQNTTPASPASTSSKRTRTQPSKSTSKKSTTTKGGGRRK